MCSTEALGLRPGGEESSHGASFLHGQEVARGKWAFGVREKPMEPAFLLLTRVSPQQWEECSRYGEQLARRLRGKVAWPGFSWEFQSLSGARAHKAEGLAVSRALVAKVQEVTERNG